MTSELIAYLIAALATAIIALGTTWLGMRHYFKQRQRELKEKAYTQYMITRNVLAQASLDSIQNKIIAAQDAHFSATPQVFLVGSKEVVELLSKSDAHHDNISKGKYFDLIVKSMRKDLGLETSKKSKILMQATERPEK